MFLLGTLIGLGSDRKVELFSSSKKFRQTFYPSHSVYWGIRGGGGGGGGGRGGGGGGGANSRPPL